MNPYAGRKYVIGGIIVLFGIIFLVRLFFLQIVESSYKSTAERNARRIEIQYPARGLIYDRGGEILVYNEAAYDLMVTPGQLQAFDTLDFCRILEIPKSEVIRRIVAARDYSVYKPSIFLRQISSITYAVMQEKLYKFPGFFVQPRTLRKYPRDIAAHALGFVGEVSEEDIEANQYYQMGDYIGVTGIELAYEEVLRGVKGRKIFLVDVHNRIKGSYQGGRADRKTEVGKNVVSTLDAGLQEYGEKLMTKFRGSIVALEPSTGEVLALVTSPAYRPSLLVGRIRSENFRNLSEDTLKPWFNRALMAFYAPGSTFKTVNGVIALQEGVITTASEYYCDLGFHMGGYSVACHMHPSPLDFRGAVQHSCNAYFNYVYRAILIDPKFESTAEAYMNWREHVLSFGFGHYLQSDFENELTGFVPDDQYYNNIYGEGHWNFLTVRSLSIGQGELGITPLQMANLAATLANRGFYYTPHVVKEIEGQDQIDARFLERHYTSVDSIHFAAVADGMEGAVNRSGGTSWRARIADITVCGKTGTAENPHGEDHSIFIAFAPKDKPRIAISVYVENGGFGNIWAAPIAGLMAEKYLTDTISRPYMEEYVLRGVRLDQQ
ncbi:MAG: penicillin-binding protein 2 [Bacteroidales bacterium]|nr:penicillin-binding protein 2 [Bacteroidales bacterium]